MTQHGEISTDDSTDADLLRTFVASHDERAFNVLIARYGPMVLGICRRILQNSSDADDAFQATFLLLAVKAGRISEPQLLGNWLFGVATRTATDIRRANHRRVDQEKRLMRILRPRRYNPIGDADLRMIIDEHISRLPEKLRSVIVCCHLQGLGKHEAAECLHVDDSTITRRLKQARDLLRKRLAGKAGEISEASLGLMLVPMVVPPALAGTTASAAIVAASGKAAGAGAASGIAKGAQALLAAKAKIAAITLIGATLAVGTTVAVNQQTGTPNAAAQSATRPAEFYPPVGQPRRITQLANAIAFYARDHGLPPDLQAVDFSGTDIDYFGIAGVKPSQLKHHDVLVIVAEHPAGNYDGPINVAFLNGGRVSLPQAVAREYIERSSAAMKAVAAGKPQPDVVPEVTHISRVSTVTLPDAIHIALAHNAEQIGPLTITWSRQVSTTLPAAQAREKYYLTAVDLQSSAQQVIWQRGFFSNRSQNGNGPVHNTFFDGKLLSFSNAGQDPVKQPINLVKPEGSWLVAELVEQAGIHLPRTGAEIRARTPASTILKQLSEGAALTGIASEHLDGKTYTKLTIVADNPDSLQLHSLPADRTYIYDLDAAMNYVVRRVEERYGTQLLRVTDNRQFEELAHRGVWLPRSSTIQKYTAAMLPDKTFSDPVTVETSTVSELSGDRVAETQFFQQSTASASVFQRTDPGQQGAATGVLAHVPGVNAPAFPARHWPWFAAGISAAVAVLALIGFRRSRHSTRLPATRR